MPSKIETLLEILRKLTEIGDVEGSAIATRDGLLIASNLPEDIAAKIFVAMSATVIGAADTAISELREDNTGRVIIEGKEIKLIMMNAGSNTILVSTVAKNASIGLILIEMKNAAHFIGQEMD